MSGLADHKDDIAELYFGQGQSYQEIADRYGRSREAVRQFLNRHFPHKVRGREFRRQLVNEERIRVEAEDLEQRKVDAPLCAVCWEPVTRRTGGRGTNRTCKSEHAALWAKARFLLDDDLRKRQRVSMANSILKNRQSHSSSAVAWAQKVVSGLDTETRTYERKDSGARQAYDEVMKIRKKRGKIVERQQTRQ